MNQKLKSVLKKIKIFILLNTKYKLLICGNGFYCGKNISISKHLKKGEIKLGKNVFLGEYCRIAAKITIDDYTMLASYVSIVGGDHKYTMVETPMIFSGKEELKEGRIEKDVWVGHGTIILQGLTIGEGSLVGAGSIVTKDVHPYTIVAGNPARFIRFRFDSKEDCIKHSKSINGIYKSKI